MSVTLPKDSWLDAAYVGARRHVVAECDGRRREKGQRNPFENHCEGACGECAFCRYYGIHWPKLVNNFKEPDVPQYGLQIRTSNFPDRETGKLWGNLLIGPDVPTHYEGKPTRYILLLGHSPTFLIRGWIWVFERERLAFDFRAATSGRSPVYWIEQPRLHPMTEFKLDDPQFTRG